MYLIPHDVGPRMRGAKSTAALFFTLLGLEFHACTSASIHTHPHPSLWTSSLTGGRRRGDRMRGREREKQMGCTAHATSRERGRGVSCCRGRVPGYYLFRLTLPTQSNPSPSSSLCRSVSLFLTIHRLMHVQPFIRWEKPLVSYL